MKRAYEEIRDSVLGFFGVKSEAAVDLPYWDKKVADKIYLKLLEEAIKENDTHSIDQLLKEGRKYSLSEILELFQPYQAEIIRTAEYGQRSLMDAYSGYHNLLKFAGMKHVLSHYASQIINKGMEDLYSLPENKNKPIFDEVYVPAHYESNYALMKYLVEVVGQEKLEDMLNVV